ncbi:MAG: integrase arm-type DNA-binding domain-containing protein [Roseovarius sp.]
MTTKIKFTDVWLQKLPLPSGAEAHYGDASCPGLSLKHTANGVKSFRFAFRLGKRTGTITLGKYPDMTLRAARDEATKLRGLVATGVDPRLLKKEKLEKADLTVAAMIDTFVEKYARPKNKSWKQAEANLRLYLAPTLGTRAIDDVRRADIHAILDDLMAQEKGTTANRALAHIKKYFGWLVERDLLEHSPADRIKRPYSEKPRDRYLTDDELRAIWRASEALSASYRAWLRLSILLGQREKETASMTRSQIIDDGWRLTTKDAKNKREHLVPLSRQARAIVDQLLKTEGEFLLKSGRIGDSPINGFSKAKEQIDKLSGVTDWKFHDLRAAVISNLGRLKYDRPLVMKIVNHKDSGVTAGYDRYAYLDEKRAALQAWADFLDEIVK